MSKQLALPGIALLEKDLAPVDTYSGAINAGTLGLLEKDDPVLLYLAMSDEREYDKMLRTDTTIMGAVKQRVTGILSYGWEIIEGEANNASSARYKSFAEAQMRSTGLKINTLRREVLNAIFLGWRPVELQWSSNFTFERRPFLGVVRGMARDPWHYAFTLREELVRLVGPFQEVFNKPTDALRWMVCTAGTTGKPYGDAWLQPLWLDYFLSKSFDRMSSTAMQRVLGILRLKREGATSASVNAAIDQAAIDREVKRVLKRLNSNNVLVEQAGFTWDVLPNNNATRDLKSLLEYFDARKRVAIAGQNLTSQVQEGSLAAATVHSDVLKDWQKADAMEESGWWNSLLTKAISVNFGEVAQDELPTFRSMILSDPVMADVRSYYDMGGTVDGRALAQRKNVPALFAVTPEDVPLRKPDPMALAMLRASAGYQAIGGTIQGAEAEEGVQPLPGQPKPVNAKPAAPAPAPAPASQQEQKQQIAKQPKRTVEDPLASIEDDLRDYYGGMAEQFLREHGAAK